MLGKHLQLPQTKLKVSGSNFYVLKKSAVSKFKIKRVLGSHTEETIVMPSYKVSNLPDWLPLQILAEH